MIGLVLILVCLGIVIVVCVKGICGGYLFLFLGVFVIMLVFFMDIYFIKNFLVVLFWWIFILVFCWLVIIGDVDVEGGLGYCEEKYV